MFVAIFSSLIVSQLYKVADLVQVHWLQWVLVTADRLVLLKKLFLWSVWFWKVAACISTSMIFTILKFEAVACLGSCSICWFGCGMGCFGGGDIGGITTGEASKNGGIGVINL